jgi:hypothetical protein
MKANPDRGHGSMNTGGECSLNLLLVEAQGSVTLYA